jgi:hypothetical protein
MSKEKLGREKSYILMGILGLFQDTLSLSRPKFFSLCLAKNGGRLISSAKLTCIYKNVAGSSYSGWVSEVKCKTKQVTNLQSRNVLPNVPLS